MSIKYNDKTNNREILLAGISPVDQILNGTSKNAIANKAVFNALKEKIDKTVSDLVNYYSKADVYNKAEVRALISTISTMDIQVVNALPTEDISTTTIYFLKPSGATTYDEYVYINNAWVKIGTTDLDLSQYVTNDALTLRLADYYTKAEIDTLLAQYALKDNVYDKDAVDALLDAKQDSLTFDNAPTKNSNNVVKSGGIYSTVDNVYKMMGENGTKNLLPSSNSSGTRLGITFTKQNDGSWIAKGSTTSSSATYWDIINPSVPFTLKPGKYILSSGANLTSEIELVLDDITSGSQVRIATLISEKEVAFTLNTETTIKCYMWVKDTTTLPTEGIHYYPMIRLASDTDSTYQPYTMTNQQLTQKAMDYNNIKCLEIPISAVPAGSTLDITLFKTWLDAQGFATNTKLFLHSPRGNEMTLVGTYTQPLAWAFIAFSYSSLPQLWRCSAGVTSVKTFTIT